MWSTIINEKLSLCFFSKQNYNCFVSCEKRLIACCVESMSPKENCKQMGSGINRRDTFKQRYLKLNPKKTRMMKMFRENNRKRIVNRRPHAAAKRGKRQPDNAEKRKRGGGNGSRAQCKGSSVWRPGRLVRLPTEQPCRLFNS